MSSAQIIKLHRAIKLRHLQLILCTGLVTIALNCAILPPSVQSAGTTNSALFHYTSDRVDYSNLTQAERENIIELSAEPLLAGKNTSLQRCSLYRFHFKLISTTNGMTSVTKVLKTPSAEPNAKIGFSSSPRAHAIELVWNTNYPECVDHYTIHWRDLTEEKKKQKKSQTIRLSNGSSYEYEIAELIPCTDYRITLSTYSTTGGGAAKRTDTSTVIERTGLSNMENIELHFRFLSDGTAIHFNWTVLPDVYRCEGDYFVKLMPLDETFSIVLEEHVSYSRNELTIGDLHACQRYNASLHANFFDVLATVPIQMPFVRPTDIFGLTVDNLTLAWHVPAHNSKCVAHYIVSLGQHGTTQTLANQLSLRDVERCVSHEVSVLQVDLEGSGHESHAPLQRQLKLDWDVLSIDIYPKLELTSANRTLTISWPDPEHRSRCFIEYELRWNSKVMTRHQRNTYVIEDFEFCKSHKLDIQMKYMDTARTLSQDVFYSGDTADSVESISSKYDEEAEGYILTWTKPKGYEMCNFTYILERDQMQVEVDAETYTIAWEWDQDVAISVDIAILQGLSGRSSARGWTIRAPFPTVTNVKHSNLDNGRTRISWSKPDTSSRIDSYVVVWDDTAYAVTTTSLTETFPKCLDIELIIFVKYTAGQTSPNATYGFTFVVAPEPVVNVAHKFTNPNYVVTWEPAEINVHCYTAFIVKNSVTQEPSIVTGYQFTISGWSDDTDYTVEIVSEYDNDHKSVTVEHTFRTPGPVKGFEIKENDNGTADLTWTWPDNPDHTAIGFAVSLLGQNHTTQHSHISVSVPFCVDIEIVLSVKYSTGVVRSLTTIKRLLKVAGPVRNLWVGMDTTIRIRWDAPEELEECVASYRVQVDMGEVITVATTQHEVDKWDYCTQIVVKVSAQNQEGLTGPEESRAMQTPEGNISEVNNLSVETTEKTLRIIWEEPSTAPMCVQLYKVTVRDAGTSELIYEQMNESSFVFLEEMKACHQITVEVMAIGSKLHGQAVLISTEMKERAPGLLTPLQSLQTTSTSLSLQTTLDDTNYLCGVREFRVVCRDIRNRTKAVSNDLDLVPAPQQGFNALVDGLDPYEYYNCSATLESRAGLWSNPSFEMPFQTLEDLSEPPQHLELVARTHDSLNFTWKEPVRPNGRITHYEVHVEEVRHLYHVPAHCEDGSEIPRNDTTIKQEFLFNAKPYTLYEISVRAVNGAGTGDVVKIKGATEPFMPAAPKELHVVHRQGPLDPNDEYNASVKVSWLFPCFVLGHFEHFQAYLVGRYPDREEDTKIILESSLRDEYELEMSLMPSYTYQLRLISVTTNFNSTPSFVDFRAPAAIPNFMSIADTVSWNVSSNPSYGAVLKIPRRDLLASGEVLYYAIMISELDCQAAPEPRRSVLEGNQWPVANTWQDVRNDVCQRTYQATPERYSAGLVDTARFTSELLEMDDYLEITIGGDTCGDELEVYCNGPLRPGTKYAVVLRIFSESGYTDNPYLVLETISEIRLVLILLIVVAILASAFLAGIVLVLRKRKTEATETNKKSSSAGAAGSVSAGDIPSKNFPVHFEDLRKNNCERLNMEFSLISSRCQSSPSAFATAKLNGEKNRYTNVLPYDFNRVVLDQSTETLDSDYINASFIDGFRKQREYIASQGPKLDSSYDFWLMIVQYRVSSIVMLTSYREGEKEKCFEYFPACEAETLQFSDISIKCHREKDFPTYKLRVLHVDMNRRTHIVRHYHFLKWPDHSICDPNDLIDFTRRVASERKQAEPLLVHCSAGVGRTGTFLALDIALQQIRAEEKVNVSEIVQDLRRQRMKMVQSFSQYLLIYQCIVIILKQQQEANEPMWKRLSKKTDRALGRRQQVCIGGGGGTALAHNFGMLPLKESRTAQDDIELPSCAAVPVEPRSDETKSDYLC